MKQALSFNDVNIVPQFSTIKSRADVNVKTRVAGKDLEIGIISSNMDSVTGFKMANAIRDTGGIGMLHRFWNIEDNIKAYKESTKDTWCSVGVGKKELERAQALIDAGCEVLVLDVAHGAAQHVVDQTAELLMMYNYNGKVIVGNFATSKSILDFNYHLNMDDAVAAYKINIGSGSSCTTRTTTGCGIPSFTSLQDCITTGFDIIQDGGIKNAGDYAKAMGLGAKACILGGMLAGCEESLAEPQWEVDGFYMDEATAKVYYGRAFGEVIKPSHKQYRGSASLESYRVQGKVSPGHRTAEGEAFSVPYRGTVKEVVQELEAGLRSAMSYVGAKDLKEFKEKCEFIQVSSSGYEEGKAHGKM